MADIKSLKESGIPLRIDGATRYVKGATKYTTCSDVIKMVLKKTGIGKEYRHMFAIFEISIHGEVPVPSGNRILKVMEAWGSEHNKFVLRKTDPLSQEPIEPEPKITLFKKASKKKQIQNTTYQSNYNHVMKLAEIISKHKHNEKVSRQQMASNSGAAESSDSDTSLEDFISQMDESKVAYLMNAFQAAIKSKEQTKCSTSHLPTMSTAKKTSPVTRASKVKQLLRRSANDRKKKECAERRTCKKNTSASVHPNKMYAVQRVNYGFVDSLPENETEEFASGPSVFNKTYVKHYATSKPKDIRRQTICISENNFLLPVSELSDEAPHEVFKRNERFRRATRCREDAMTKDQMQRRFDTCSVGDSSSSSDQNDSFSAGLRSRQTRRRRIRGRRLQYFDVNRGTSAQQTNPAPCSLSQKLVDYSLTDDEFSIIETHAKECSASGLDSASELGCSRSDASETSSGVSSQSTLHSYTSQSSQSSRSSDKASDAGYGTDNIGHEDEVDSKTVQQAARVCENVSDFIKELFSKKHECVSEDEEMDSFMRSRLAEDFSDDSICSVDHGKETQ